MTTDPLSAAASASRVRLADSTLEVFPLCLGGNVFGWTADETASFEVLDAYRDGGGNFIDTADVYSAWVPGNVGGESEAIIGRWANARGVRERVVIATKVCKWSVHAGLRAANIAAAIEDSLRRLQTDYVDLYYAHAEDPETPLEESLGALHALVTAGTVRAIGLSNFSAESVERALAICERDGLTRPIALQPGYSLVDRGQANLLALCEREQVACVPYYALANGFLTGKYRPGSSAASPRAARAGRYLENPRAAGLLATLDDVAAAHATSVSAVAIAWLRLQPGVAAPIASARNAAQLAELLPGATLELDEAELSRLAAAWS